MARIPLTAREQLLRARELGHELSMVTRTRDDFPDALPKYYVRCSCGWAGRVVRSRNGANASMVWHLGRVISEYDEPARVNGL